MQPMDGHFYTKDEETLWTRVFCFVLISISFFSLFLLLLMLLLMMMLMLILLLLLLLLLSLFFLFFFYLTLMAGPVLTILLNIFFSLGLSYFSTVVQAVTYTYLNMHTLPAPTQTHTSDSIEVCCNQWQYQFITFVRVSHRFFFHTPWVHSTSLYLRLCQILQGKL